MTVIETRRSVLFTPGDQEHRMLKALTLSADTVCFDLEDAVAPENKAAARDLVAKVLRDTPRVPNGPERCVRLNALTSDEWRHDMAVALTGNPDALMVPKAEDPLAIIRLEKELSEEEARLDMTVGSTRLLLIAETALGVLQARQVGVEAGQRLGAFLFGAEDLAADAGMVRTKESVEVLMARSMVGLAAASLGVGAIDQVYTDIPDLTGLEAEARFARTIGYTGKMAIHPSQIEPIHRAFTPSVKEVEYALRLTQAASQRKGGAFGFEGRMIDQPLLTQAARIIAVARRAGMIRE